MAHASMYQFEMQEKMRMFIGMIHRIHSTFTLYTQEYDVEHT